MSWGTRTRIELEAPRLESPGTHGYPNECRMGTLGLATEASPRRKKVCITDVGPGPTDTLDMGRQ